jgi:Rrf2 family protein
VEYEVKLTTKGRYGFRVMLELALNHGNGPISVETIAARQDVSGNYIHVLVTALRRAGFVRTVRGPNGGYELKTDPCRISLLQIIEALEGSKPWGDCIDEPEVVPNGSISVIRDLWCEVVQMVEGFLSSQTLADLAEKQRAAQEARLMYYI